MATGSGKTKVISLALAWQYFNAVAEARDDYARTFLLIAPNVIVFERLRTDFEGGRIFHTDPIIPDDFRLLWDFQCYMRGRIGEGRFDGGPVPRQRPAALRPPRGRVNRARRDDGDARAPARRRGLRRSRTSPPGSSPVAAPQWSSMTRPTTPTTRIATGTRASAACMERSPGAWPAQLDLTATPRHTRGQLFSWTVFDYPLKQAMTDGVVKRPVKGVAKGIAEQPSEVRQHAIPSLSRGRRRTLEGIPRRRSPSSARKPVLFIMMNDTAEADDVGDWLQKKYPSEFGGERPVGDPHRSVGRGFQEGFGQGPFGGSRR